MEIHEKWKTGKRESKINDKKSKWIKECIREEKALKGRPYPNVYLVIIVPIYK